MSHEENIDVSTWAWATEHGAPEWASTEQLVAWLGRGELPPHTLVWKRGWGEWLPAMMVAELAAAFPRVTAGSRRVARTAAGNAAAPPPVPIAHYPRLRLLARDVLSESPLPPAAAPQPPHVTAQAERRAFLDPDRLQQDVATSQVPAAAMLEAARAMKERGAPAMPSSAERWAQLELGTFGEPPPAALGQPHLPAARVRSPQAAEPTFLLARERASSKPQPRSRYGRWLLLGAIIGSTLGLLSVSWPDAADLLARVGLSLPVTLLTQEDLPGPHRSLDTRVLSLSSLQESGAENACLAPADMPAVSPQPLPVLPVLLGAR